MANKQALRELQARLAERLHAARTQARSLSWLAVECGGRGFLFPLREACEISARGHIAAMKFTKPGVTERQIHGVLLHSFFMENADRELEGAPGGDLKLRKGLRDLSGIDVTIVDVPGVYGATARNAMVAATHLLIPISCDRFAYDSAVDTVSRLAETCDAYDLPMPPMGVLLTTYRETNNSREIAALCEETWPGLVFETRIRNTEKIKELSLDGMTALDVTPARTGTAREDYELLAKEIERKWL